MVHSIKKLTKAEIGRKHDGALMTYEECLRDVKKGLVTDLGKHPVFPAADAAGQGESPGFCMNFAFMIQPGITNTMLTNFLRELERDGFINRMQFNELLSHVEHSLTARGRDLMPIFYQTML